MRSPSEWNFVNGMDIKMSSVLTLNDFFFSFPTFKVNFIGFMVFFWLIENNITLKIILEMWIILKENYVY